MGIWWLKDWAYWMGYLNLPEQEEGLVLGISLVES